MISCIIHLAEKWIQFFFSQQNERHNSFSEGRWGQAAGSSQKARLIGLVLGSPCSLRPSEEFSAMEILPCPGSWGLACHFSTLLKVVPDFCQVLQGLSVLTCFDLKIELGIFLSTWMYYGQFQTCTKLNREVKQPPNFRNLGT